MYKIVYFVPKTHLEQTKEALFSAGAGTIGTYECCSFETEGFGQFKPTAGSDPFIGKLGEVEKVKEMRVELICVDERIRDAIMELKISHPYEEPAIDIFKLHELNL